MLTTQPRSPLRFLQRRAGRIALLTGALAPAASLLPAASQAQTSTSRRASAPALSGRTAAVAINGEAAAVSPEPVITRTGSVLVPLRGVLEKLQAQVLYVAADRRIEVRQGGKLFILREGQLGAFADGKSVELPAAPASINGAIYVPLRALAELFGYRVEWDNAAKSVLINTDASPVNTANHRLALQSTRRFGVGIDFTDASLAEVPALLDLAKSSGVDMVQTRFDWNTIQPEKGGKLDFSLYDAVVSEARKRNMIVVGILGDSARWASQSRSENPFEWRYNAPRKDALPAWSAYVQATVARFRADVHAWQVWDQPVSWKLRASGFAGYSQIASLALVAARKADPKAIVHAAEPGGVNLTYLNSLRNDAALSSLDGVRIYPASQWQPGLPVAVEDNLLPLNAYQSQLQIGRDVWVGGLWYPAIEREGVSRPGGYQFSKVSDQRREQIFGDFSPGAQSDFLLKSASLSIAAGADKVLWNTLRDDPQYEVVEPINPEWGSGLVRRDLSPRPAFNALATLSRLVGDSKMAFIGALSSGPDVIALAFDNGEVGHVVAWSPSGRGRLTVNDNQDPQVAGATYIQSRADSQILFSNGDPASQANAGSFELGPRVLWITRIAASTASRARESRSTSKYLQVSRPLPRASDKALGRATFGAGGAEDGLLWRKYAQWRGQAVKVEQVDGVSVLTAEPPPDVTRPADGKPFLFFDVSDDLSFFNRGANGTPSATVRVRKSNASRGVLSAATAGLKIEYNTAQGTRATRFREIEVGDGFADYTFDLPGAVFSNVDGSDMTINTFGSKQNVYVANVTLNLNGA